MSQRLSWEKDRNRPDYRREPINPQKGRGEPISLYGKTLSLIEPCPEEKPILKDIQQIEKEKEIIEAIHSLLDN